MISPDTFSIFWKFWFSGFLGGKRAKNGHKWQKVCCAFYLRNHTSYDCDFWYTCNIMTYPDVFFHFFKILIFRVVRRVKGQKMAQNDNFFVSLRVLGIVLYMIVVFRTRVKWWYLQESFYIFKILIFQIFRKGGREGLKAKNDP